MPCPKDPIKLQEYKEKQRKIALERGYGKWMIGKKNTPGIRALKKFTTSIKGKILKFRRAHKCEYCGKIFYPYHYRKGRRYCSRKCYNDSPQRKEEYGKRNVEYWENKPRTNNTRVQLMGEVKYRKWRTAVFQRDNWTCQGCKTKGYIEAHHLKSWINFPAFRYTISNGISLCSKCHLIANRMQRLQEQFNFSMIRTKFKFIHNN